MKRFACIFVTLAMMLSFCAASAELSDFAIVTNADDHKVILDTDMSYMGDDTYALFALLQADAAGWVDLLGVTSVGGNVLAAPATAACLNLLEAVGRTDIPVYMGTDVPMQGFRDLEKETTIYGGFNYVGGYYSLNDYTSDYKNLGKLANEKWPVPKTEIQSQHAVDFMIEQVHKYPGKVTIFAIGPCMNVAAAIIKDPTFAENAAGIVYMGGAFEVEVGDMASALAEFNWWYDPDAVAVCLRAGWKSQTIIPHDVGPRVPTGLDVLEMFQTKNNTAMTKLIVEDMAPQYADGATPSKWSTYCFDPITVGTFLCPSLVTRSEMRDVAMETSHGYCYGTSVCWRDGMGPYNSAKCNVILDVDRIAFWTFMSDLLGAD